MGGLRGPWIKIVLGDFEFGIGLSLPVCLSSRERVQWTAKWLKVQSLYLASVDFSGSIQIDLRIFMWLCDRMQIDVGPK